MVHHILGIRDLSKKEILSLIKLAIDIKKTPKKYSNSLYEKTLLLFFEAPSLRTEISFETAIFQMGGEAIDYHTETSPWKIGKETLEDVAKVISQYCDIAALRIYSHEELLKFAKNSTIPIINAMDNFEHPCQILGDLMTIFEKKGNLKDLTLAYLGDSNNNVTHSLMYGCSKLGININIGCPNNKEFSPLPKVLKESKKLAKTNKCFMNIYNNPKEAVKNADIVYTDSFMSYHIKENEKKRRLKVLMAYQVNKTLMNHAKKHALFMHCLPATRGEEVTDDVIDGKRSIILQQAKNRLYTEKAILLKLLKR
ncbi:ornithine carbamoyltransferase [Candidatus Woesearchaeota archaeon]|nr:ornithine carbamoyltransferase [Candidatus Woesearchaeota archaeon]